MSSGRTLSAHHRARGWHGRKSLSACAALAIACFGAPVLAQPIFNEVEPNDGKYAANGPFTMSPGNSIQGFTTGTSTTTAGNASADNFIVKTTPAAPGIYQHRLVITTAGTAGHIGTIRGLTQTGGVINSGTDAILQTSVSTTTPPRYNQWYGFGKEESIYYRITGTASTTSDYVATLETTPITPIELGTYYNGLITIDRPTGMTSDTDFWVYDSKFDAIPDYGNDDPNTLTRLFAPGVYYIAYTNFNFANDQPAATGESFLSGSVTDFRNVAANSSTTLFPSLGIRLTDAFNSVSIPTPKNSQFEVVWLRFTVTADLPTTGACCLPDGSCVQATASGCAGLGGVFSGDNVDCSTVTCAQPGACCFPIFTCSVLSASQCTAAGGIYQGDSTLCGTCPPPPPGVNPEVEPNDSKAAATGPIVMAPGNTIVGVTTGSSTSVPGDTSADYFLVRTTPAGPGIYRHRLVISTGGTAGHIGTIRGLTQTAGVINPGTDAIVQTSSTITTPPRYVQWYGFGREEQIYFRVTGTASTTSFYTVTLETELVSAQNIGTYFNGDITLARGTGVTTDTDFWVYDSNFNAIPDYGNDDPDTLTRPYAIGTYYVAYTNFNFANDQPAATGDTSLSGNVLDFPNAAANSSTTLLPSLAISVTDAFGPTNIATPKQSQFDVVWLAFSVNDTPPVTGACCLPNGACVQATATGCVGQGGTYQGDNFDCMTVNCPQPPPGVVAIIGADSAANVEDIRSKLAGTGLFTDVVTVPNVTTATPELAYLQQFDAVLVMSNTSFFSGVDLGNVLADYVDSGGGVVVTMFTVGTTTANRFLAGRWDETYQIIPGQGGTTSGTRQFLGTVLLPDHPVMEMVTTIDGGSSSFRPTTLALTPHAVLVAQWTDGRTLAAVSSTRPNRVDLGIGAPSNSATYPVPADQTRLLANALRYAGGLIDDGCPADWNGDDVVNSNDISAFITAWLDSVQNSNLIADFNGDMVVNSNDISAFITAWLDAVQNGC